MSRSASGTDKLVGQNIRILRTAKRMSQTELAQAVGVTFQQVQKYEKGTNRVGAGRLSQIAAVLEVPVGRLFEDGADSAGLPGHAVVTDLLTGPYAVRLLQAFARISDVDLRRRLLRLVEGMGSPPKR
jgi:transcriptional regulator with XRE-family HTH domain